MTLDADHLDGVASALKDSDVYVSREVFSSSSPVASSDITRELKNVLNGFNSEIDDLPGRDSLKDLGVVKIALLSDGEIQGTSVRDVAQYVSNSTGAQTVIVQTPSRKDAVSSIASRATIEKNYPVLGSVEDVEGKHNYLHAISHQDGTTTVNALILTVVVAAVAVSAWCARMFRR